MGRTRRKRNRKIKNDIHNYSFVKWMYDNLFKNLTNLKISTFNGTGRGIMAGQFMKAETLLISIPQRLLITKTSVRNSILMKCPSLPTSEILTLFLVIEKFKKNESTYFPYLEILPKDYTTCIYWNDSHLSFLSPSVRNMAQTLIEESKKIYHKLSNIVNKYLESEYPQLTEFLTFEVFKWAWSSVNTRCVFLDCGTKDCKELNCEMGHSALAPFLDLFNHSPDVKVKAGFNRKNDSYEIFLGNNVNKYSQIFINYGNHDNRRLLLEYGFICSNNPNDLVLINKDDIRHLIKGKNQKEINKLWILLQDHNLLNSLGFTEEGVTWNLKKIFQILSLENQHKSTIRDLLSEQYNLLPKEEVFYLHLIEQLVLIKSQDYIKEEQINIDKYFQMILALNKAEQRLLSDAITFPSYSS